MTSACAWMAVHVHRTDLPCGAGELLQQQGAVRAFAVPDSVERCAAWAVSTGRRVSWVDAVEKFGWNRYHAMKMLRKGAERGLLVRIASYHARRPDLFEGPKQ